MSRKRPLVDHRYALLLPVETFGKLSRMRYLDYNATTPVLPEVFDAMRPFFCEHWANPSPPYPFAKEASDAIEGARKHIALLIGAQAEEIVFTSSATESNQTVLSGVIGSIATSTVEHSSINDFLKGRDNVYLVPVDSDGQLSLERLDSILGKQQVELVSVIWANNETGVFSPIAEICKLCKKYGVLFHSDAVQAAGKTAINVGQTDLDYLSLSAHKIYGPKGIGALYVREGAPFRSLLIGSQENSRRGGTEAVPLIVGFGKAVELANKRMNERMKTARKMRDLLENGILQTIPNVYLNGSEGSRLSNTSNIGFRGMDSEIMVQLLGNKGIMVSSGSACKSSAITPSHVLTAMGRSHDEANEAIRFSVSHLTTTEDVSTVLSAVVDVIETLN